MYDTADIEPNKPDVNARLGERPKDGDLRVAARFLKDTEKPKDSAKSEAKLTENSTATGAKAKVDNDGLVREIRRTDGSNLIANYDSKKNLSSFTEIASDGNKVIYKLQKNGETYKAFDKNDKAIANLGTISKVELSANGNLSFLDQSGQKVIVRGNGGILFPDRDKYDVKFDPEGRIAKEIPSEDALKMGAKVRSYSYKGKTEDLTEVKVESPIKRPGVVFTHAFNEANKKWECHDNNGKAYDVAQGKRGLTKDGVYVCQEAPLKVGNSGAQMYRFAYPNGFEELKSDPADTGVQKFYNNSREFIGMQPFIAKRDAEGKIVRDKLRLPEPSWVGKKYSGSSDGHTLRIIEADPKTGATMAWEAKLPEKKSDGSTEQKELKFEGKVVVPGADSRYKSGQSLPARFDFDFKEDGTVTFRDENGTKHREFKDGTQRIDFPNGSILITDNYGNPVLAMQDKQNKLEYTWRDSKTGERAVAQVYATASGVKNEIWESDDNTAKVQPDGRFSYEDKDGKLVFVDLDSIITKYAVGKDDKGTTLTPVEVDLPGGKGKRIIQPGKDGDIEHPQSIVDTFIDANGREIKRSLTALPVITPNRDVAAHNRRIKEYELKEEVLSEGNLTKPGFTPHISMQGKVMDLQLLRNGDVLCTAPDNSRNPFQPMTGMRFELRAKEMTDSMVPKDKAPAPKSMRPIDTEKRLELARNRLEQLFNNDIASRLPKHSDDSSSTMESFLTDYLQIPQVKALEGNELNDTNFVREHKNSQAYHYELAYAILEQQKIEAAERAR